LNETLSNIKSAHHNGSFIVCNNRAHITAKKEKKEKIIQEKTERPDKFSDAKDRLRREKKKISHPSQMRINPGPSHQIAHSTGRTRTGRARPPSRGTLIPPRT
jgi:hypothetical protein